MCRQIFDKTVDHPAVTNGAPSGDVGVNFGTSFNYQTAGWRKIVLSITVSGGASDIKLWGRLAKAGVGVGDDAWGLFQDMFGVVKLGVVAAALPVGSYHFTIPDVGGYAALYVQNSANTVTATITPLQEGVSY